MRLSNPAPVLLLLAGIVACQPRSVSEETLIFLVRHAERADEGGMEGQDPPLSEVGRVRAELLATMLNDAGITHVHSTDRLRTRETVAPAAAMYGLGVAIYDGGDLEGFARHLRSTPGRHLVVGHSNSNPELVTALGGDPHGEIDEMEYDRLYLLSLGAEGTETVLLRFGEPFGG